jgi:hypothetical protein
MKWFTKLINWCKEQKNKPIKTFDDMLMEEQKRMIEKGII